MATVGVRRLFPIATTALLTAVIGSVVASRGQGATEDPFATSLPVAEAGDAASESRGRSHYLARAMRIDRHLATDAALRDPLSRPVTFDFNETPLRQAIDQIADTIGIRIRIDADACDAAGRDPDSPVTIALAEVPARTLIRAMLPKELTSIPRDGHLVVTSRDAAGDDPAIWFYPTPSGLDAFQVREIVERLVEPGAWNSQGGPSSIVCVSSGSTEGVGVLIQAPEEIHERLLPLLVGLDRAAWHQPATGTGPVPRHVRAHTVLDAAVREALCERLAEMCNESLGDAADPDAEVSEIGTTLVVRSTSPEFHLRAANLISRIAGREEPHGDEVTPAGMH